MSVPVDAAVQQEPEAVVGGVAEAMADALDLTRAAAQPISTILRLFLTPTVTDWRAANTSALLSCLFGQ